MNGIIKNEESSGNIYSRELFFEKSGTELGGHQHNFDHTTFCLSGSILIEVLNKNDDTVFAKILKPGLYGEYMFLIKSEDVHRITSLCDNTLAICVYSHRGPNGMVIQEPGRDRKAYL